VETEGHRLIRSGWNHNGIASLPQDLLKTFVMPAHNQKNDGVLRFERFLRSHSLEQLQRRHKHTKDVVEVGEESMTQSVTWLEVRPNRAIYASDLRTLPMPLRLNAFLHFLA
jgi:hypothetical protein